LNLLKNLRFQEERHARVVAGSTCQLRMEDEQPPPRVPYQFHRLLDANFTFSRRWAKIANNDVAVDQGVEAEDFLG
jgi:hypothetical protein